MITVVVPSPSSTSGGPSQFGSPHKVGNESMGNAIQSVYWAARGACVFRGSELGNKWVTAVDGNVPAGRFFFEAVLGLEKADIRPDVSGLAVGEAILAVRDCILVETIGKFLHIVLHTQEPHGVLNKPGLWFQVVDDAESAADDLVRSYQISHSSSFGIREFCTRRRRPYHVETTRLVGTIVPLQQVHTDRRVELGMDVEGYD